MLPPALPPLKQRCTLCSAPPPARPQVYWASSGATVQSGNVACTLLTSPGGFLAQNLVASVPALASQAAFILGASLASGSYTMRCASLADASVVANTPVLSLSGGALWVTSPAPNTVFTFSTSDAINVTWGLAGGTVLGGFVRIELWGGCCFRNTLAVRRAEPPPREPTRTQTAPPSPVPPNTHNSPLCNNSHRRPPPVACGRGPGLTRPRSR